MKKLVMILIISIILAAVLIVLAFLYIDMTGRKSFFYDIFMNEKPFGSVNVDKFVTEDRIIYKGKAYYPHSAKYPIVIEKLVLKKRSELPLKYTKEAIGTAGAAQTTVIEQKEDKTDFLQLSPPKYLSLKDFETGHKTMVFSPYDIMTYMPIMEKYNFWKKGTQFFEVMIPLDEPVPILRDKVEVKYEGEEYISIKGRKVEAELFSFRAGGLPETRVLLSKYMHQILSLEVPRKKLRFLLAEEKEALDEKPPGGKEVFFEAGNQILSGRLWTPEGKGPFPSAIIVSGDGPMTNAQRRFRQAYAEHLSAAGIAVLLFDKPGQGKSQGNLADLDDEGRIRNIQGAAKYLSDLPEIQAGGIVLIGYKGGGYLSLKAARELPELHSCITLSMSLESLGTPPFYASARALIGDALKRNGYGPFEEKYVEMMTKKLEEHLEEIARSTENFSFFLGVKVPLKGYREYIARVPYETVLYFDKPLFMIFGRKDISFNAQAAEDLKKAVRGAGKDEINIAVIERLNSFMGKNPESDELLDFELNKDVLRLIENWAKKEKKPTPPPAAIATGEGEEGK
jgi:pimeloyl-ACP methyl ester carboxylesterase